MFIERVLLISANRLHDGRLHNFAGEGALGAFDAHSNLDRPSHPHPMPRDNVLRPDANQVVTLRHAQAQVELNNYRVRPGRDVHDTKLVEASR
jgi:hypothetical protein